MATEQQQQPSADKPRSSTNDDFHGFALYKFKARRPNNGDTQKKQNDDEKVDGGVSSKGASEETGEDSVADFLRKEATTNNDFSLSLLSTNLSGEQETELRTFMAKRLTRGPLYSGSGHISTLEEFFPDQSAICYYCLLRGGKETGEFEEDNKSQQMDSLEYGSYLSKDYVICLVSGGKSGLDLFQKELDEYSKGLLPSIDRYCESQDVQESFKHLEEWYDENVKFVCRCTSLLKEDLASIIQLGLLGGKLQVDNEDTRMQKDFKMFVDACSTANVLDSLNGTKKDTEDLAECFAIIPMEIVLKTDGIVCSLSNKVTTRFCREWTKTMMSGEVDNPVFLRQVIENYKLRVNHDMNTLRRLLRQAEMDHYALYRSYVFLLKSGNGPILLRNTTLEAHALASEDTLNIIKALEEYIEENKQFGIEALSE